MSSDLSARFSINYIRFNSVKIFKNLNISSKMVKMSYFNT